MSVQYTLIGSGDDANIVVFVQGSAPQVAHSSHPNFDRIVDEARAGNDPTRLFDLAQTALGKFRRLSERITTRAGRLYLDGVEVANALAEQVLRFIQEDVDDWIPLVRFFENVQANPNEHSREQLYNWLAQREFTITYDGMIVGYKGVTTKNGSLVSIHSGKATVNGVEYTGQIPNPLGAVVEMPRDAVQWDPSVGCHTGLHVGTYEYANNFAQGTLLEVHVNPRDVVSVPTDCDWAKVRCCRYVVVNVIDQPYTVPVLDYDGPYDWEQDESMDDYLLDGDPFCDGYCNDCEC